MNHHNDTGKLREQLDAEQQRSEELSIRLTKSIKDLNEANGRETELRTALSKKDKEVGLVKLELKEIQRRADQEIQARSKAEGDRTSIRKQLEELKNIHTREGNQHQFTLERISNLEKEKRDLADNYKKAVESSEKLKKINAELSVAKAASEASLSDLNDKMLALTEDRNLLESEVIKLQSHLQHEQNQRNELSGQLKDSDAKNGNFLRELNAIREREQRLLSENAALSSQKAELEKVRANLELETKSISSKYDQLRTSKIPRSADGSYNQDVTDDLNNRTEQVKDLNAKLAEEKSLRLRAEATIQDKEREMSMMSIDYKQLQYKLEKSDADHRQESEKARAALALVERLKEEKSIMQSEYSVQGSEITLLKTNEKRLLRDLSDHRCVLLYLYIFVLTDDA